MYIEEGFFMAKRVCMGNEAIALGAAKAGVSIVSGYPGTPSTEIIETLIKMNTVISAVMILCIFGMVIYLTKDM